MDINKAIRKQKKSYKRFVFSMGFIFFILPTILFISKEWSLFYIAYLCVIEVLILISIFAKRNSNYLRYNCNSLRLKLKLGVLRESITIFCNKIFFIDVEEVDNEYYDFKDFNIIILMASQSRSKNVLLLSDKFLNKHPNILKCYNKLIKVQPDKKYYYLIIRKGGLVKYVLLDTMYRNCVNAEFTEESIEKIKEYRKYNKNNN